MKARINEFYYAKNNNYEIFSSKFNYKYLTSSDINKNKLIGKISTCTPNFKLNDFQNEFNIQYVSNRFSFNVNFNINKIILISPIYDFSNICENFKMEKIENLSKIDFKSTKINLKKNLIEFDSKYSRENFNGKSFLLFNENTILRGFFNSDCKNVK